MFNIPQIIVLNIEELFNLPVVPLLKKYLILKNTWLYISKLRFSQSNPHTFTTGKVNITFSLIYILICHFPFFPSMAYHNKATQLIFFSPIWANMLLPQESVYFPRISLFFFSRHMHKTQNIPLMLYVQHVVLYVCRLLSLDTQIFLIRFFKWDSRILRYVLIYVQWMFNKK